MARCLVPLLMTLIIALWCGSAPGFEPTLMEEVYLGWPSVQGGADGNPVAPFMGNLTGSKVLRERFVGLPSWIVSEDFDGDSIYEVAVLFADGTLRIMTLSGDRFRTLATARKMAPGSAPLVLTSFGGEPTGGLVGIDDRGDLVSIDYETGRTRRLASGFSQLSHPVAADLDKEGDTEIMAVNDKGFMSILKGKNQARAENSVQLLPDTRITAADLDSDGILEIAALSKPVDEATPGRLGDDLEAGGIAVFNWDGRVLRLKGDLELPSGQFFEALTPMMAGLGADPVLMLPVTDNRQGTQVRSYSYNGGRIRERRKGPVSDTNQWIHVLGSSRLGSGDRFYLLTALVHEDGEGDLELYRLDLAQTRVTLGSSVNTYSPGSRLLETALMGDFDGDGELELLAPGKGRSTLLVYNLDQNRLKGKTVFNSSGRVGTNLCPGDFNGDGLSDIIFGLDDGTLVILLGE